MFYVKDTRDKKSNYNQVGYHSYQVHPNCYFDSVHLWFVKIGKDGDVTFQWNLDVTNVIPGRII